MKTKLLLPCVVLCSVSFHLSAQEKQPEVFKHDIGFNTDFIFRGVFESNQTPFSLMYKTYTSETKAIRLGATVSLGISNNNAASSAPNSDYSNSSSVFIALSVGKEFQKNLSQKWTWYYGGDIVPSFTSSTIEYYVDTEKRQENSYLNAGLSVRPFIGIRFNIHHRLYVSAEANASLSYVFTKNKQRTFNPDEVNQDLHSRNLNLYLSPASGLYLFYRF